MNLKIITILLIAINYNYIECDYRCPAGWDAYDDQLKCLNIITDSLLTYDNAVDMCAQLAPGSTLLTIHSPEEQDYLIDYLFVQNKLVNSLWLGARVKQQNITWMDNSNVSYTNWLTGRPINSSDVKCIEMQSEDMFRLSADDNRQGKWYDTDCKKRSMVVCQSIQSAQVSDLVKLIMETRKKSTRSIR
ncbi:snaclec crotocetin-1-like [Oppia nitens]|uniref:snaclec crotocetin-1-like n=1 Tax=Oppia nitens TaxID=1686743 RepID=UPI0023DB6AE0|nr:snaclec crotocetin-1-like [Oppia nitens]